jgi:hypothetical protein
VTDVGLHLGDDSWEYPFWVLAKEIAPGQNIRFRQVGVDDPSKKLIIGNPLPGYVIATRNSDRWFTDNHKSYRLIYADTSINILVRRDDSPSE